MWLPLTANAPLPLEAITPEEDAAPSPQLIVALKLLAAIAPALNVATVTLLRGTPSKALIVVGETTSGDSVSICWKFTGIRLLNVKLPVCPDGVFEFDKEKPVVPAV